MSVETTQKCKFIVVHKRVDFVKFTFFAKFESEAILSALFKTANEICDDKKLYKMYFNIFYISQSTPEQTNNILQT